jgi:nanoRNase/pAp phosphatase (c-di-AMP/oligoRNAs hydrolase)
MMHDNNNLKKDGEVMVAAEVRSKLVEVLEAHRGERHAIILHDFPDPDAISSAYAHKLISAKFDIETDIIYSGKISHRQNIAMVRLLGIDLIHYEPSLDFKKYQGAVFVDNQGMTVEGIVKGLEAAGVPVLMIIDHHEPQERLEAEFSDIRRSAGASATIYSEYLQEIFKELDKSRKEHIMTATALMHGIMTDTGNFIKAKADDFYAAAFLSEYDDPELLGQIMSQSRSKQVMEIIRRALGGRVVAQSYSIASIGYLRAEDRDAIPQAADFLLTEENVHTAIVYGIVTDEEGKESLIGSLRTSKITIDPDTFIKETFGKDWAGNYFGGGKMSAGAFEIPIGFLSGSFNEEYRNLKWQVYDLQMKQKIFAKTGIEPD